MYRNNIKNTKDVADRSGAGVKLYYSILDNAVYTEDRVGRYHVTTFLRENTEEEIVSAVNRWLSM